MWYCALVSCTPPQSKGLFLVCAVLVLDVIVCSFYYFLKRVLFYFDFHHDSCECYWFFIAILFILKYMFRLSVTQLLWFCKCATSWMFLTLDILRENWIEYVTFGHLYALFTSLLECFTGEFQALSLIVLVVFGVVDWPFTYCTLVHFLAI